MTITLSITLLILAYLFAVGAKAMIDKTSNEIGLVLLGGTSKHYIVLLVFVCFPITVWNGYKVCAYRVKTWIANKQAAMLFKAFSKRHKDNPELQKDLQELGDLFKKL